MRDRRTIENNMAERESMDNNSDLEIDQDSDSGNMEIEQSDVDPSAEEIERLLREADISDIPQTIIVKNVNLWVFENDNFKEEFERTFKVYDENATFQYFKSFRRVRVNYSSPLYSANAKVDLHNANVCGQYIKCYFFQPICLNKEGADPHLKLPEPYKQFLISPPASPPVGWEQCVESQPVINLDLLQALTNLTPGEAHELHPPSKDQPGIVVHVCEDPDGYRSNEKPAIVQTKCPERNA